MVLVIPVERIKNIPGRKEAVDQSAPLADSDDFCFASPARFCGTVENQSGRLCVEGELSATIRLSCALCGEEFCSELLLPFKEYYRQGSAQPDFEGEYDIHAFCGSSLDITVQVLNAIVLFLPLQCRCSDVCRGLCGYCGANLNHTACDCKNDDIDPRLAKLKDFIFDSSQKGV